MPVFIRQNCGDLVCVLAGRGVIFFHMGLVFGFLSFAENLDLQLHFPVSAKNRFRAPYEYQF